MDQRALGIVLVVIGAAVAVVAALANPLGLGQDEVFGWLQITGVIAGVVVALIGLALAMYWYGEPATTQTTTTTTPTTTTTEKTTVTEV